jgi:hypothetical protein
VPLKHDGFNEEITSKTKVEGAMADISQHEDGSGDPAIETTKPAKKNKKTKKSSKLAQKLDLAEKKLKSSKKAKNALKMAFLPSSLSFGKKQKVPKRVHWAPG